MCQGGILDLITVVAVFERKRKGIQTNSNLSLFSSVERDPIVL